MYHFPLLGSQCHFQDGRDSDRLRYILPVKAEEFWQTLEEDL